jgi:hypothetical protein
MFFRKKKIKDCAHCKYLWEWFYCEAYKTVYWFVENCEHFKPEEEDNNQKKVIKFYWFYW